MKNKSLITITISVLFIGIIISFVVYGGFKTIRLYYIQIAADKAINNYKNNKNEKLLIDNIRKIPTISNALIEYSEDKKVVYFSYPGLFSTWQDQRIPLE